MEVIDTVTIPILQLKKMILEEIKQLAQGSIMSQW